MYDFYIFLHAVKKNLFNIKWYLLTFEKKNYGSILHAYVVFAHESWFFDIHLIV